MDQSSIKKTLRKYNCTVWKLCDELNVSRSHYYELAHHHFKGHEKQIQNGLDQVILQANKKAGAVHAN